MPNSPLQYIDLFAGCGGLSTGLHLSGWKGLPAVERNPAAFATLKANLVDGRKHFNWPSWLPVGPWDIKSPLRIIRETCTAHGIQYIFSALSEDIPAQEDTTHLCPQPEEIILTLDDSGNMGRLFTMGTF